MSGRRSDGVPDRPRRAGRVHQQTGFADRGGIDPEAACRRRRAAPPARGRRERFNLVFAENVHYGWRRNCYGLKPVAITVAGLALVGSACVLALAGGPVASRAGRWTPALGVSALLFLWWLLVVTE